MSKIIKLNRQSQPKRIIQKLAETKVQNATSTQRVKTILSDIQQKLIHDIQIQSIKIPLNSLPLFNENEKSAEYKKKQEVERLQRIKQQKQEILRKLKQMESQQKKARDNLNLSKIKERSLTMLRPRSQISSDDLIKLRKLKLSQRLYEESLEKKTKLFEEEQKKYKQQSEQLAQRNKVENNETKKTQIIKRLQQLSQRQIQRAKKIQQDKKQYIKVKYHRRIYQQLQQKWQKLQHENQQIKKKRFEDLQKQKSVNLSQIKQHQKKYQDILKKHREQINKKRLQTKKVSETLFVNKIHKTKFHTMIQEQEQIKKRVEKDKWQNMNILLSKRKQFSQSVKINYAPRAKSQTQLSQQQNKSQNKRLPLNKEQSVKKGLLYLQEARSKANKNKSKLVSSQQSNMSDIPHKIPKYHNYLIESRKTRQKSQGKSFKMQRNFDLDVRQAKNIMKRTNFSEQEKIQRIKMVAERLQFDPKTTKAQTLVRKIQAKMQILEALQ